MDAERFRQAYQQLEALDERLGHKLRPRETLTMGPATQRQLEERLKLLSQYTLELKEIVRELFVAIASGPAKAPADPGSGQA